jgi:hypothetical protein
VLKNSYPVRWAGRLAVVVLPERVGLPNAGQVSEELLSVINRGADALIADMTATSRVITRARAPCCVSASVPLPAARTYGWRSPTGSFVACSASAGSTT